MQIARYLALVGAALVAPTISHASQSAVIAADPLQSPAFMMAAEVCGMSRLQGNKWSLDTSDNGTITLERDWFDPWQHQMMRQVCIIGPKG